MHRAKALLDTLPRPPPASAEKEPDRIMTEEELLALILEQRVIVLEVGGGSGIIAGCIKITPHVETLGTQDGAAVVVGEWGGRAVGAAHQGRGFGTALRRAVLHIGLGRWEELQVGGGARMSGMTGRSVGGAHSPLFLTHRACTPRRRRLSYTPTTSRTGRIAHFLLGFFFLFF